MKYEELILFLFFLLIVIGCALMLTTANIPKQECAEMCEKNPGCLEHQLIRNGEWNFNDTCILYFKDRTETKRLR